ncbi:hypothetical protein BDW72DRAFT_187082 [Aspergillus terricola var. indicus]
MSNPDNNEKTFTQEMQISAQTGNLALLKSQISRWEAEVADESIPQKDHLTFKLTMGEELESLEMKSRTGKHGAYQNLLNRLLVQAARTNQVAVVKYILDERRGSVTSMAVRRAMAASAFDVLEVFREHGWDVNDPAQDNLCPILGFVTNNESRVRWCLERGADPNARNNNKYQDIPSQAGRHASVSTLQLLAEHGADFARSNALQRAAESNTQGRVEAMQWLLDSVFPINQREFEYDPEEFHKWRGHGLGSALHFAVMANCPEKVRLLLERGAVVNLKDTLGKTPREWGHDEGGEEVLALLDTWEKQ